ncbi:DUF6907 domain-containing protein [Streptomyces sp. NPDC057539]|uniref:DUF6907 domain-containing protein n=1 Tax=Streptomyces sp. NPDC057539 TaxID=3346159 RepID=UPI0036AFC88B
MPMLASASSPVPAPASPAAPVIPPPHSPAATAPSPSPGPRTWLRRIETGGQIVETCPPWCTDPHRNDAVGALDDLQHGSDFEGTDLEVFDAEDGTCAWPLLSGRISVDPYSEDARRRVPHISLDVFKDEVMEALTPKEFAAVIARVRAHCDRLEAEVLTELVRARAEYR